MMQLRDRKRPAVVAVVAVKAKRTAAAAVVAVKAKRAKTKKAKKAKAPVIPARNWGETSRADVAMDPSLLLDAPVWWPHLFDKRGILGRSPIFPVERALAIIDTRACEICRKGGVKAPPRRIGLTFGVWGHDQCVESLLSDARHMHCAKTEAAQVPTITKQMYNPHSTFGGKNWELNLMRDALHPCIPYALTRAGVSALSIAGATAAGKQHRAGLARGAASFAELDAVLEARAEARQLVLDEALEARVAKLDAALAAKQAAGDDVPASVAAIEARYGRAFLHHADVLGSFLESHRKSSPYPIQTAVFRVAFAIAKAAA